MENLLKQVGRQMMTAKDLLRLPERDCRYELVKGRLIRLPFHGWEHGAITAQLAYLLGQHVEANHLGKLLSSTGVIIARNPDTVRAADINFISRLRCPSGWLDGYLDFAPDMVVEVFEETDDMPAKLQDWFDADARTVLVVYPGSRQIAIYRSLREVTILTDGDTLTAPDILPGFSCLVSDIFA